MRTKKKIDGRTKLGRQMKMEARKVNHHAKRNGSRKRKARLKISPLQNKPKERPWYMGKPIVSKLIEDHSDARGRFVTVENAESFQHPIGAVAIVTRKTGSVFAEHRHAREGHTCILVSGKAVYHERNGSGRLAPMVMPPFIPIFTPPGVDHAFEVTEDLTMVVVANISRTQAEYEADVVRLVGKDRLVQGTTIEHGLSEMPPQVMPLNEASAL